jgi:hypothetical protein
MRGTQFSQDRRTALLDGVGFDPIGMAFPAPAAQEEKIFAVGCRDGRAELDRWAVDLRPQSNRFGPEPARFRKLTQMSKVESI